MSPVDGWWAVSRRSFGIVGAQRAKRTQKLDECFGYSILSGRRLCNSLCFVSSIDNGFRTCCDGVVSKNSRCEQGWSQDPNRTGLEFLS